MRRPTANAHVIHKRPGWTRGLDVVLRTAHVAATSVLFGGAACGVPLSQLTVWLLPIIVTGGLLVASEVYHCRHWPYQGRGLMGLIHMGFLGVAHFRPEVLVAALAAALVFGMVGSHMPKRYRYWSVVHRRVVPAE